MQKHSSFQFLWLILHFFFQTIIQKALKSRGTAISAVVGISSWVLWNFAGSYTWIIAAGDPLTPSSYESMIQLDSLRKYETQIHLSTTIFFLSSWMQYLSIIVYRARRGSSGLTTVCFRTHTHVASFLELHKNYILRISFFEKSFRNAATASYRIHASARVCVWKSRDHTAGTAVHFHFVPSVAILRFCSHFTVISQHRTIPWESPCFHPTSE